MLFNSVSYAGELLASQPFVPKSMNNASTNSASQQPLHELSQPILKELPEVFPEAKKQIVLPLSPKVGKEPLEANTYKDFPKYEKISLPEAINYSLTHNLDIQGNRLDIDIAKNKIKVANRLKNPYFLSFFNMGEAAIDNPNTMGLVFPFEIAKRAPRKCKAKAELELTKGKVALAELSLRLDVRQAYVDLVAAKTELKILNDHKKLLQELLYIAERKYDVGAAPQMDVIHAKMTLNQLLIQFNSANTNVYTSRYNFNKLLNSQNFDTKEDYLPEQKEFISILTPNPVEKLPDFKTFCDIALEKRLDLKNAQKEVEVAQKNLVTVLRQRVPDIELGAGYMFVPSQMATVGRSTSGAFAMVNVTDIPLLYQYTPEIKNARIQLEQKCLAYNSLRNKAIMDLRSVYDEFNTAQDNLNYYSDILLMESREFLNMSKRSYEVGKSNITDFIFIQQSYKNIMMGYTVALANYYDAWINILREVNYEELKLHG